MSNHAFTTIAAKKNVIFIVFIGLVAAAIFIFGGYFKTNHQAISQERDSLTATGTIEAKSVMTSFKVPGKINNLLVDEGAEVKQGQKIASLEAKELAAKLSQAQGAYQAAQAQANEAGSAVPLTSAQVASKIEQAQAGLAKAQSDLKYAQQTYDRMTELHKAEAISDSQYDQATSTYTAAQAGVANAQGQLNEAQSAQQSVAVAEAKHAAALGQSNQAAGAVQEAQTYMGNTILTSPLAGFITQKYLEQGEMVNAGTPVFEITDLYHPYLKVFINEQKIGRVKLNQTAEVTVDAFPSRVFKGKIVWINNAGDFAVKKAINEQYDHDLRSFEVKINLTNSDLALKTGMTATARIIEGAK